MRKKGNKTIDFIIYENLTEHYLRELHKAATNNDEENKEKCIKELHKIHYILSVKGYFKKKR